MSADNGVYVARFPDGYRICYAQAIENVTYYEPGTLERKEVLRQYFGKSVVYEDVNDAFIDALSMAKTVPFLEYGVCILRENFESFLE